MAGKPGICPNKEKVNAKSRIRSSLVFVRLTRKVSESQRKQEIVGRGAANVRLTRQMSECSSRAPGDSSLVLSSSFAAACLLMDD